MGWASSKERGHREFVFSQLPHFLSHPYLKTYFNSSTSQYRHFNPETVCISETSPYTCEKTRRQNQEVRNHLQCRKNQKLSHLERSPLVRLRIKL